MYTHRALDYTPPCPHGFVIPEDMNNPDNWFVDRSQSDCAVACKMPILTDKEWHELDMIEETVLSLGLFMITMVLLVYAIDRDKNNQYLIITFAAFSCICTVVNLAVHSVSWEDRFCRNSANPIDPSDGFTLCAVQSFTNIYCSLALCICWLIQAIGVYVKVVLGIRSIPDLKVVNLALILGLPLISVAILGFTESYGYSWATSRCSFTPESKLTGLDVKIFYGPIAVMCICGIFCMVAVIVKIIDIAPSASQVSPEERNSSTGTTLSVESPVPPRGESLTGSYDLFHEVNSSFKSQVAGLRSFWEILQFLRTPLLFISYACFFFASLIVVGLVARSWYDPVIDDFESWAKCAITHYDGSNEWIKECGRKPSSMIPLSLRQYLLVVFSGNSVFVALIYSPGVVSRLMEAVAECGTYMKKEHIYNPSQNSENPRSFVEFNVLESMRSIAMSRSASFQSEASVNFENISSFRTPMQLQSASPRMAYFSPFSPRHSHTLGGTFRSPVPAGRMSLSDSHSPTPLRSPVRIMKSPASSCFSPCRHQFVPHHTVGSHCTHLSPRLEQIVESESTSTKTPSGSTKTDFSSTKSGVGSAKVFTESDLPPIEDSCEDTTCIEEDEVSAFRELPITPPRNNSPVNK